MSMFKASWATAMWSEQHMCMGQFHSVTLQHPLPGDEVVPVLHYFTFLASDYFLDWDYFRLGGDVFISI